VIFIFKKYIFHKDYFYDKIISCKEKDLKELLEQKNDFYFFKRIPKKGGYRELHCLINDSPLRALQEKLRVNFLNRIPIPDYVYGFVKGSSYQDYLIPHTDKKYYLRVDIKHFFNSITKDLFYKVFGNYFKVDDTEKTELLNYLFDLVSFNEKIPQGAITSPSVSNIVFRSLDIRINKLCNRFNITYTRYADDLLFSSNNEFLHNKYFLKKIAHILYSKGFKINSGKVRKTTDYISLNGFVVGRTINLSRKRLYDITKVLFIINRYPDAALEEMLRLINSEKLYYRKKYDTTYFNKKNDILNFLGGYRSFLISWSNFTDSSKHTKLIKRIEETMIRIDEMNE
jgi:RNA-directed DNA polymerase